MVATRSKSFNPTLYVPIGFDPLIHLSPEFRPLVDSAHYFLHVIHLQRAICRHSFDAYIGLQAQALRQIVPQYKPILNDLVANCALECDNHYIKNEKCTGYRFFADLRTSTRRIELTDSLLADRLRRESDNRMKHMTCRLHQHLYHWLQRVRINAELARRILAQSDSDAYRCQSSLVDMIDHQRGYFLSDDFGRRVHTPITSLRSDLRRTLSFDNQPLVNHDIRCSQPFFLAVLASNVDLFTDRLVQPAHLQHVPTDYRFPEPVNPVNPDLKPNKRSHHEDVIAFAADCCQGVLYDKLAQTGHCSREEAKIGLFKGMLFCRNSELNSIGKSFRKLYPSVAEIINNLKAGDHKRAAMLLQRQESHIMLGRIATKIMQFYPTLPFLTIHDSILTKPQDSTKVLGIMRQEFEALGWVPQIKVEK